MNQRKKKYVAPDCQQLILPVVHGDEADYFCETGSGGQGASGCKTGAGAIFQCGTGSNYGTACRSGGFPF
jgi:hypothetical protein